MSRAPQNGAAPVLWHLKVSHYNEKVRWALDLKRISHVRRAAVPGRHQKIAKELTGSSTLPVLVLDGEAFGDSTRIIEVLEERHPEPPLYPADPGERRRALELEEFFDEELGAHTRLLAIHHMLPEGRVFLGAFAPDLGGVRGRFARATFSRLRPRIAGAFGIDHESVALSYRKVHDAGERFRSEVGRSGYLVGDSFTVADLTLAALLAPLAAPVQFPYPQPQRDSPLMAGPREALAAYGLLDWTRGMYARHRSPSAEIAR